jgi:hypothetical protein
MAHRLAPQARAELSDIWTYIARESGNLAAADGVIDAITAGSVNEGSPNGRRIGALLRAYRPARMRVSSSAVG